MNNSVIQFEKNVRILQTVVLRINNSTSVMRHELDNSNSV